MQTVFNKMDLYEEITFDEWLEPEVKANMLEELRERWENETTGHCVFISALERRAIDKLRATMLALIREVYVKRYPYKTGFQQYDYGA